MMLLLILFFFHPSMADVPVTNLKFDIRVLGIISSPPLFVFNTDFYFCSFLNLPKSACTSSVNSEWRLYITMRDRHKMYLLFIDDVIYRVLFFNWYYSEPSVTRSLAIRTSYKLLWVASIKKTLYEAITYDKAYNWTLMSWVLGEERKFWDKAFSKCRNLKNNIIFKIENMKYNLIKIRSIINV